MRSNIILKLWFSLPSERICLSSQQKRQVKDFAVSLKLLHGIKTKTCSGLFIANNRIFSCFQSRGEINSYRFHKYLQSWINLAYSSLVYNVDIMIIRTGKKMAKLTLIYVFVSLYIKLYFILSGFRRLLNVIWI